MAASQSLFEGLFYYTSFYIPPSSVLTDLAPAIDAHPSLILFSLHKLPEASSDRLELLVNILDAPMATKRRLRDRLYPGAVIAFDHPLSSSPYTQSPCCPLNVDDASQRANVRVTFLKLLSGVIDPEVGEQDGQVFVHESPDAIVDGFRSTVEQRIWETFDSEATDSLAET